MEDLPIHILVHIDTFSSPVATACNLRILDSRSLRYHSTWNLIENKILNKLVSILTNADSIIVLGCSYCTFTLVVWRIYYVHTVSIDTDILVRSTNRFSC